MSKIKIQYIDTAIGPSQVIQVNGKKLYGLRPLRSVDHGTYRGQELRGEFVIVDDDGLTYEVYGGVQAGGRRNEWYMKNEAGITTRHTSLIDCVRTICAL